MKKNILSVLIFFGLFVLSGCGGGSDNIPNTSPETGTSGNPAVELRPAEMRINGNIFNLSVSFVKKVDSSYQVELSDFDFSVEGCTLKQDPIFTPNIVHLDGSINSFVSVDISGTFDENCTATKYTLAATQKTIKGTKTDSRMFSATYSSNEGDITPVPSNGFFNTSTPLEITQVDEAYEIKAQIIEDGYIASGKVVEMLPFDSKYGSVSNYSATTGEDGYAVFNYIPPAILPENGTSTLLQLEYVDDNNISSTQNIVLNYHTDTLALDTTGMTLTAAPVQIIVANGGENAAISLYLSKAGAPVADTNIKAKFFDPNTGTLDSYSASTNANGQVVFNYTAPAILPTSDTVISFEVENGAPVLTEDVTVKFNTSISVDTTGMTLTSAPTEIIVANGGESAAISLYLSRAGAPVADINIKANFFDPNTGTLDSYSASTNGSGQVVFNYTAPAILPTSDTVITFEVENGAPVLTEDVAVKFTSTLSDYAFVNTTNITIQQGSEKQDIRSQLTYQGVPIVDKTVTMLAFSESLGTIISSYTTTTDTLGYAVFTYMAPVSLTDVNGTSFNLTLQFNEESLNLRENATVTFNETTDTIVDDTTLPIIVIPSNQREITLDSNSKTIEIAISVYKDISPYTQGSVKVELPEKVLNGTDVGRFDAYEVLVNDQGVANFTYTGPSNLQALLTDDDNESIFKFYHAENSEDKQEMKVHYQLPADPYISLNYELDIVASGDFSMGIPNKEKTFNVLLKAKDSAGNDVVLTDENITKITVLTTNSTIAQILNTATNTLVNSLELNAANNSPFILKSKSLSGLVPLEVTVEFNDVNGKALSLSTIVNIRVFSGPASAISISYVSTGQDENRSKYIETLAISATDEYGNRVNTRPNISLGAIVGYAVDGREASSNETNETKRLFYGRSDIDSGNANGEIVQLGANTANFEDNTPSMSDVFKYVNAEGNNTDKLVVFGEQKAYEAMGKWDISKINNNTLSLEDNYFGIDRSGLYYGVGHNYYQDQCREDGREWVGSTDSETYQLDEEGTAIVTYKYDYHLTGKDSLIWVNLDGIQPDTGAITRIGETVKHTLRGKGFTKAPANGYALKAGTSGTGTFIIWHENAPERYRNAHFSYAIASGSSCLYRVLAQSNPFDARTCDNRVTIDSDNNVTTPDRTFGTTDGTSYITFYLEAGADDCTFDITDIVVSSEF